MLEALGYLSLCEKIFRLGVEIMGTSISANFTGVSGGLIMCLISFSIVFLVCGGLMALMMSLKHVVRIFGEKKKDGQPAEVIPADKLPVGSANFVTAMPDDEGELVAVITAAVTSALGSSVRVTGISPAANTTTAPPPVVFSAWRMASIMENSKGV